MRKKNLTSKDIQIIDLTIDRDHWKRLAVKLIGITIRQRKQISELEEQVKNLES